MTLTATRGSDKAQEMHEQLLGQVRQLTTSQEWLDAMTAAAKFHDYSLGNWLLIWTQAEMRGVTVSRMAGYKRWQELGRQVRKGEHGYAILAPIVVKRPKDDGSEEKFVAGFRGAFTFDIGQTDGDPIPEIVPTLLDGDNSEVLDRVAEVLVDMGWSFERGDAHGANGYTRFQGKQVVVSDQLSGSAASKTALHELAHVLLHSEADLQGGCRGTREVEAEATAYVAANLFGMDTSAYSVAYIALWADRTADAETAMLKTAERVVRTARKIRDLLTGEEEK